MQPAGGEDHGDPEGRGDEEVSAEREHFDKRGQPLKKEGVNKLCATCRHDCKQCGFVQVVTCPKYEKQEVEE